jgi:hypothetical protein
MNAGDRDLDFVRAQLRAALPPCHALALETDLWPRMLRRLEEAPARFGWFEAALAGLIALTLAVFPGLIPALLYHL